MNSLSYDRYSRIVTPLDKRKGPGQCRYCGGPVGKGRRTFCSEACVDQWLIRTDPEHVRRLLFKKEQGICQQCQLDTEALKKQAHQVAMEQRRVPLSERHWWRHAYSFTKVVLEVTIHGQQEIPLSRTLWEADHIVPVVEGGGACGLENYRTLCYWCHKLVTKAMHARRALERRQQKHAAQIT